MTSRRIVYGGLGAVGLLGAVGGAWIVSLPASRTTTTVPPIGGQEGDALLEALKPPKRTRPLIAVIGINDATETTDYLMPYGILRRADVADVVLLATGPGPVTLYPALTVEPHATAAAFDAEHPDGADFVIVPATTTRRRSHGRRRRRPRAPRSWASAPGRKSSPRPGCSMANVRQRIGTS